MVRARIQGLNLIEVIIAASLLSLIVIFVFEVFPTSLLGIRKAEDRMVAMNLAGNALETLRCQPYDNSQPGSTLVPDEVTNGIAGFTKGIATVDGTPFSCAVASQAVPGGDPTKLKYLVATVSWPEKVARSTGPPAIKQIVRQVMIFRVNR